MSTVESFNKKKIRQSFSSAVTTYDDLASLQRSVGLELLNYSALNEKCSNHIVLDVGCGTGFLTQQILLGSNLKEIIAIDIALCMVKKARSYLEKQAMLQYICADAEYLPFATNSFDKVISNLALQWCQNLTEVFNGFKRVLKPSGELVFSTFGPETLKELKQSWACVDHYAHVNDFFSVDELNCFLEKTGFSNIRIKTKKYQSAYPTVIDLMRELKGIGAHHVISGRNRKTTRKTNMDNMIKAYEKHRKNGFIPATYEIIFISASIS